MTNTMTNTEIDKLKKELFTIAMTGRDVERLRVVIAKLKEQHSIHIDDVLPDDEFVANSALMYAVMHNNMDVVYTLINEGSDINQKPNNWGHTVLMTAVLYNRTHMIPFLLEKGSDVSLCFDSNGNNCISVAARYENIDMLEILLYSLNNMINNNTINNMINHPNQYGETALHVAAERGYKKHVELLLDHGCDKRIENKLGHTADMLAHFKGYEDVSRCIRDYESSFCWM